METKVLSVHIDLPAAEAYEFLSVPENFPKWASWLVETPEGTPSVRFSERNSRGVLDHQVNLPGRAPLYVPVRVVPNAAGCELMVTIYRAADADSATRDLQAAKRLLELERTR